MPSPRPWIVLVLMAAAAALGWFWPLEAEPAPIAARPTASQEPAATTISPRPDPFDREPVPLDDADREDLALTPAGSVTGLVFDLGNRALAAAHVTIRNAASPGAEVTATTDSTGHYSVTDLAPGNYRVRAAANGFAAATTSAQVRDAAETQVETLRLAAGTTLRGEVVDGTGLPITSATVQAAAERTTSGVDGRFDVPHLPLQPCTVEVRAEGWLTWQRTGIDPAQPLRVVLPTGLVIAGAVYDAASGQPLEHFAVRATRLQSLRDVQQGPPEWQLRQRLQKLQQGLGAARDATARANDERAIAEYSARLAALTATAAPSPRVPADLPAPTTHSGGQFMLDRLDEGLYVVEALAKDHVFARTEPFVLQRDVALPPLRIDLRAGLRVHGLVLGPTGNAIRGAAVELLNPRLAPGELASPRLGWLVGTRMPDGGIVARVTTDSTGAFAMPCQEPGIYRLVAQHPEHTTTASPPFAANATMPLRLTMQPRAQLTGIARGVPEGRAHEVAVLLLGGASNLRRSGVDAAGNYRFDGLEPGEYIVRAGIGDAEKFAADQLRALLTSPEPPRRDVVLAAGERRTHDFVLSLPPTGSLRGTVLRYRMPEPACRLLLDVVGAARPLTTVADAQGNFVFPAVPAGECTLRVQVRGSRTQELLRETVTIAEGRESRVQPTLRVGALAGRVIAGDGAPAADLNGEVWLLPGCTTLPASLAEYRRTHTVQLMAVRGGTFRFDLATAGLSLAIVRIRNREPSTQIIEVAPATSSEVDLNAGPLRP